MMQLRLLTVLALVLATSVQECDAKKFFSRWRESKKNLRQGKNNGELPKLAAADEPAAVGAAGADVSIEKQPDTPLKTEIIPAAPKAIEEPSVPGANGADMRQYHAMGPPGLGPPPGMGMGMNGADGESAPLSIVGASA